MLRSLVTVLAFLLARPLETANPAIERFLDDVTPAELHENADSFGTLMPNAPIVELLAGAKRVGWALSERAGVGL